MAQRKLRPLPHILNLINELTDDQRADLLDYLRGRQPKKERKASKKGEKAEKPEKAKPELCVHPSCGKEKEHFDHTEASDAYHIFRTSVKQKERVATG